MWGGRGIAPLFMTQALGGGMLQTTQPGYFTRDQRARGTHWKGCVVGLRAGVDAVEQRQYLLLPGTELRLPSP